MLVCSLNENFVFNKNFILASKFQLFFWLSNKTLIIKKKPEKIKNALCILN